jgi:predicted nucleic acid-binding protein
MMMTYQQDNGLYEVWAVSSNPVEFFDHTGETSNERCLIETPFKRLANDAFARRVAKNYAHKLVMYDPNGGVVAVYRP